MSWKSWVIVGVAVAVMCASGGLLMASNMGFKINKALFSPFSTLNSPKNVNWISLPYNHPYPNAKAFCNAIGSVSAAQSLTQLDPATGTFATNFTCNGAGPGFTIDPLKAVRYVSSLAAIPNAIFVGASNESSQLTFLAPFATTTSPKNANWFSVPYHCTWAKANDVCVTVGNLTNAVSVIRLDPVSGSFTTHTCGSGPGGAFNFSLVIGEAIQVRKSTAGNLGPFFPPHF
jgi:hypothetical protein